MPLYNFSQINALTLYIEKVRHSLYHTRYVRK